MTKQLIARSTKHHKDLLSINFLLDLCNKGKYDKTPLGRALVRVRPDLARSALQVRRPPLQQTPPPISLNGYHVVLLLCSPDLLPASLYDSPRWVSEPRRRQVQGPALAAHRRTRPPLTSLCASLSPLLPRSWWLPLPEVPIFSAPSPCCCSHAGPRPGRCLRQSALRTA